MKLLNKYIAGVLIFGLVSACDDDGYIDPITPVDPGPDEEAPVVDINNPGGDVIIPFTDTETDLNFRFQVTDDIEIENISVQLNGEEIATFNEFKDYRNFTGAYLEEDLGLGEYNLDIVATDISGKSTTESVNFEITNEYEPIYDGEIFYMPFEGQTYMEIINEVDLNVVGDPGFSDDAAVGMVSYEGAEDSYLTFPTENLNLGDELSATFWYKVNATPDRAGILVISPVDLLNPTAMNNRTSGFRLFREASGSSQRIKLNVGTGTSDSWFDGQAAAGIDPAANEWVHIAFTISDSHAAVYINGEVVSEGDFAGVDWTGVDMLSIMSGAPRFTGWGHLSDQSLMDELRIFNKALTQEEIQQMIEDQS